MARRCFVIIRRLLRALAILLVAYAGIVLLGLIPVNNDFQPTPDGVEVFLVSNPVHADVVLPMESELIDWREQFPADCFQGDTSKATHVAIGWGDQGFFLETPTWADLRISTAAKALFWPTHTCLHVTFTTPERLGEDAKSVKISQEQYRKLVEYVNSCFRHNEQETRVQIKGVAYGPHDAFFEAHGIYHALNTCNCWIGRVMRSAGMRAGWLTPMPKTVFLYLPE